MFEKHPKPAIPCGHPGCLSTDQKCVACGRSGTREWSTYQKISLEPLKLDIQHIIDPSYVPVNTNIEMRDHCHRMVRVLALHLKSEIQTAVGEGKAIAMPADWWEAVKARWAPGWFLRRWPVQMRVVTFRAHLALPRYMVVPNVPSYLLINRRDLPEPIASKNPIQLKETIEQKTRGSFEIEILGFNQRGAS